RGMGKNCIHGQYTGYDMLGKLSYDNRITPWKNLFHGSRWILYYQMRNLVAPGGIFQSIINYDGTVREIYRNLYKDELSEIKQGIGKLILNSKQITDGIIFTYSYTSCLFNRHTSSYFSAKTLIQDLGYQHDLISYAQLENYQIPASARILFLADCISMSESEIESVKKFVSSGGIVIADAQAAIYNQHGVKYSFSPIDEIFGINRSNIRYSPEKKTVMFGSEQLSLWIAESVIKVLPGAVFKGTTQDGQPVVITNSYGKGQAVYLNMYMVPYAEIAAKGAAGEIVVEQPGAKEIEISYQKIIRQALEDFCGIKPMVNISPETCFKEVFLFTGKQGKSFLFGILPSPRLQKKTKISISLPTISNIMTMYDVREKKQSTSGRKFEYFLKPGRTGLLAFTPYSVKKIVVNGPKLCYQGEIFNFEGKIHTSTGVADGHVIRVQVFDSRNREIPYWSRTICADRNTFKFSLSVDHSMEPSWYKLVATDIISGTKGTAIFRILHKK
ncbi:MAG: beta-galactosidase trimerization domain-containing protein, partial [Candidatus Ratteibacteria bacterium]